MSKDRKKIFTILAGVLAVLSVAVMVCHIVAASLPANSDSQAEKLGRALEDRLEVLEGWMGSAFSSEPGFDEVPPDMVIYRYRNDSLIWWRGQFPIGNDDIRETLFSVSPAIRRTVSRPLRGVGEEPQFALLGNRSYIVKALRSESGTVIGGIELSDSFGEGLQPTFNSHLPLSGRYSLQELSYGTGSPVVVRGVPLFLLLTLSDSEASRPAEWAMWVALALILAAAVLFVLGRRSMLRWAVGLVTVIVSLILFNIHATGERHGDMRLFSPEVYAGEVLTPTLGSMLLLSVGVLLVAILSFLARESLDRFFEKTRTRKVAGGLVSLILACGIVFFVRACLKDLSVNSDIPLQLVDLYSVDRYTVIVYGSLIAILSVVPMLLHRTMAMLPSRRKRRNTLLKVLSRLVYSLGAALFLVISAAVFSLDKEQKVAATWANRLAMDRDIDLEPKLLSQDFAIASDPIIARLSQLNTATHLVLRRLSEYYLSGISKNYNISVYLYNEQDWNDPAGVNLYNERIRGSEPVSPTSHFMYGTDINGRIRYSGVFDFFSVDTGISRLLICLDPKSGQAESVFSSILGMSEPGELNLPPAYSYARYFQFQLTSFEGDYPYPTLIVNPSGTMTPGQSRRFSQEGYMHFLTCVDTEEVVTVSRPLYPMAAYVIITLFLMLVMYVLLLVLFPLRSDVQEFGRTYYNSRIRTVILGAVVFSLISMAAISVYFVYKRSSDDRRAMMRSRISAVQTLLQSRLRYVTSLENVSSSELGAILEDVSSTLKADLIIYRPDGRVYLGTTHEVFERMLIGTRINEKAKDEILTGHKRFYIGRERVAGRPFYGLYAPVFNSDSQMLGIVFSPYSSESYAFRNDTAMHILAVFTILIILLFIATYFASRYMDRMFRPLISLGDKMSSTDLDHLEYIIYDHDDEVSSLVNAYNRMVKAFSDSSRRLAQAERDKAWSEMARQVAHEIKNPLTPIKLRLQMLIRMKQSGNPAWTDKFDEVSSVVLEHIDILADTANEFSTFAKLYSEEPVEFDLDAMIKEEVSLFEGREGVSLQYMGLSGARIIGPKPQLTRVLVNLVTNAIQAVEAQGDGQILISLRNSQKDGFYDIVVEDNGPGVKDENRSRLFTPDFTTKTGGSGLGLAICRNIVEKCGGDIAYSRSFVLGGACFTVRYPKI